MKSLCYVLYITKSITKGDLDEVIKKVNAFLINDKLKMQFESTSKDPKYWLSLETTDKKYPYPNEDYFLSFRHRDGWQFKNPNYIINNTVFSHSEMNSNFEYITYLPFGNKRSWDEFKNI